MQGEGVSFPLPAIAPRPCLVPGFWGNKAWCLVLQRAGRSRCLALGRGAR